MIDEGITDETFGNVAHGRANPPPRPTTRRGTDSLSDLNFARGTRIRVLKDNGSRGLVGLEGVVVQSIPGSVVVELENDPLIAFRANMAGGFELPKRQPQRHFRVTEVERA